MQHCCCCLSVGPLSSAVFTVSAGSCSLTPYWRAVRSQLSWHYRCLPAPTAAAPSSPRFKNITKNIANRCSSERRRSPSKIIGSARCRGGLPIWFEFFTNSIAWSRLDLPGCVCHGRFPPSTIPAALRLSKTAIKVLMLKQTAREKPNNRHTFH